jgi:pyrimidine operon attenuation protein/uracil phosphoribosyltransferase
MQGFFMPFFPMKNTDEKKILTEQDISRALVRIAHEILEGNRGTKGLALIGIRTRGVFLAQRLQVEIQKIERTEIPLGSLDITLYRDDLGEIGPSPMVRETDLPFDLTGKIVVLVDDVLYTGRTVRAALDALIDFGRPRAIQLAVLVDRGHRELPIKADYVGKNIPTSKTEEVILRLKDLDGSDEVVLVERRKP